MDGKTGDAGRASEFLRRLESLQSLPTLSPITLKLVELASDEKCSASELADLVKKDPSLAVRVLRLANSAVFASRQPVATLGQAVVKVGFHRLRLMALSLSLRDTFPMGKVGGMDYEKFWRSSLYRALLAKSLAQRIGTCHPEEAFLAGLILEIGVLILFDFISREGGEWPSEMESLGPTLVWEKDAYGVDHRQIGESVLRIWKFPESIVGCQSGYGEGARQPGTPPLVQVCELARVFSEDILQGAGGFAALFKEGPHVEGLGQDAVSDILMAVFNEVQDIAEQLRLELDREKDLLGLMEKANRALGQISERMSSLQEKGEGKPLPTFESMEGDSGVIAQTLQAVAHEIRNPLLAVGGFAKKLASALDPSSEGGKYAQIVLAEAMRLESTLSGMTTPRRTV